ncbi:MAG TPA: UDP-N-acetylglucosamine 2-epimerase (non-hydrolyzing) [Flavobacteriales bacterium]|nr:UDP-N-acetylglucosamine 2-epimerase (non-hydrolyzing) [Flavobacteriales bacterium]
MKIITVIGARPQFIKAAAVSHTLRRQFTEVMVHTGQHYDANMSDVFFEELNIPKPDYHLEIGSGNHGAQTGAMLIEIEKVLLNEKPDYVLVYGDTNSTLAGALAASKLLIPVIHVEAGLRSFNKAMPEEQNRIVTDHLSDILFVPTQTAINNLKNEGITRGVANIGDVMYDAILHFTPIAAEKSQVLKKLGLKENEFSLCTIHRAENTNDIDRLRNICGALNECEQNIVLPLHPRTLKYLGEYGIKLNDKIRVIEPVGYLDMVLLEKNASKIITDSGGVQKEAFFMRKPCITMRDQTEWVETVECGWNVVVGADKHKIKDAIVNFTPKSGPKELFGKGNAAQLMADYIQTHKK